MIMTDESYPSVMHFHPAWEGLLCPSAVRLGIDMPLGVGVGVPGLMRGSGVGRLGDLFLPLHVDEALVGLAG